MSELKKCPCSHTPTGMSYKILGVHDLEDLKYAGIHAKPCPECQWDILYLGTIQQTMYDRTHGVAYSVKCMRCDNSVQATTQEYAVQVWNGDF